MRPRFMAPARCGNSKDENDKTKDQTLGKPLENWICPFKSWEWPLAHRHLVYGCLYQKESTRHTNFYKITSIQKIKGFIFCWMFLSHGFCFWPSECLHGLNRRRVSWRAWRGPHVTTPKYQLGKIILSFLGLKTRALKDPKDQKKHLHKVTKPYSANNPWQKLLKPCNISQSKRYHRITYHKKQEEQHIENIQKRWISMTRP